MKIKHFSSCTAPDVLLRIAGIIATAAVLSACSMGQMVVRGSQTILDSGSEAMNRETDLQLAEAAIPANLKLIEGMLIEDPDNRELLLFAAEGFYGYGYGFIELDDPARAAALYRRCQDYALRALALDGIDIDPGTASEAELLNATASAGTGSVPALFWSASCLAKEIDLNRDDLSSIAGLSGAAILMQRVMELDAEFYYGGAYLFFGVYYGGRSPLLGGDFARAEQNFQRAAEINDNKLLMVDLLRAEYLHRQQLDRQAFHDRLVFILDAPDDLYPEMALVNAISKQRAAHLLTQEDEWF
jgi:tetratricopeptide (TPR) repeat protein